MYSFLFSKSIIDKVKKELIQKKEILLTWTQEKTDSRKNNTLKKASAKTLILLFE
jgi:hypothetical protein